ncbi:MAG: hypothetical protein AB8B99_24585 [Phormidesmis sp.]
MLPDIMKMKATHAVALIASTVIAGLTLRVNAEPTTKADRYYAGQAAGGQSVVLDLTSISSEGEYSANFTYFLGEERIPSQANCAGRGSWTTIDTGVVYYPQSPAALLHQYEVTGAA